MGTITLNVDDTAEEKFRQRAERRYGKRKGSLGKAASEAFEKWAENEEDAVEQALTVIEKGIYAPQLHYKKRSELYEGSHRY